MKIKSIMLSLCLMGLSQVIYAQNFPLIANVYNDDNLSVRAGILNMENRIIKFGDVLPMVVQVEYDASVVRLQDTGPEFFTQAWPEEQGAFLLETTSNMGSAESNGVTTRSNIFRFQVMACPEGKVLCKGSRFYDLPEFTLEYTTLDEAGNDIATESAQFRPWPANLMIASAIPLGEEGELNSFATYFPTGAYPNPLTGQDLRQSYTGMIAGGLVFLLGGILMSPFSFFKRKSVADKSKNRWEDVLVTLKSGELQDEKEFLDSLRKCLVWYIVDELKTDPFYWLKHETEVVQDEHKGTGDLAGYRELFIDVLHSPEGKNDELLDRFTTLIAQ
ncbi:MAG: hypothetical protein HKN08_08140 [Gammaproteobacteria bacterium]|nr:hypothetical protein [Gammaproteobacteria bacterium]